MMIGDLTMAALQSSLRGLSARRGAHQNNIANVETPGYLAQTVDFEASLAKAIEIGDPAGSAVTFGRSDAPLNLQGNNVQVDQEFVGLTETSLRSQLVIEAMNNKFRLIRSSITGQ